MPQKSKIQSLNITYAPDNRRNHRYFSRDVKGNVKERELQILLQK